MISSMMSVSSSSNIISMYSSLEIVLSVVDAVMFCVSVVLFCVLMNSVVVRSMAMVAAIDIVGMSMRFRRLVRCCRCSFSDMVAIFASICDAKFSK